MFHRCLFLFSQVEQTYLGDVLTTFIAWFGVKISKKAPDRDHPYGHERLECVASLVLGAVLLITGLGVGKNGLETIASGQYETLAAPGMIALVAAVLSIVGKEAMYWYARYYAKLIHSSAFMADAWHHRSDAFSSVGSLIGIAGARLGFPVLDSVASVVICLFIIKVAYDIMKDAVVKMLDTSCGEEYESKIIDFVSAQEGVVGVDQLRTRMFGSKVYIDLEIAMDGSETLSPVPSGGRADSRPAGEPVHRHQAHYDPRQPGGRIRLTTWNIP